MAISSTSDIRSHDHAEHNSSLSFQHYRLAFPSCSHISSHRHFKKRRISSQRREKVLQQKRPSFQAILVLYFASKKRGRNKEPGHTKTAAKGVQDWGFPMFSVGMIPPLCFFRLFDITAFSRHNCMAFSTARDQVTHRHLLGLLGVWARLGSGTDMGFEEADALAFSRDWDAGVLSDLLRGREKKLELLACLLACLCI